MTSAKKIYLAVAGGLVAAGVVLAGIGFIASGFDPAVFTTHIDTRDSTIVLGGVEVDDTRLPSSSSSPIWARSTPPASRIPPRPRRSEPGRLPAAASRRNPNLNLYATGPKPAPIRLGAARGP
ncbi:MAG: hypothetical protein ACLTYW_11120 [Collinsella sp.]